MSESPISTTAIQLYQGPDGRSYLLQRERSGGIRLVPLDIGSSTIPASGDRSWSVDPLALLAIGGLSALLVGGIGYWLGFAAGSSQHPVVIAPPVCDTHKNSFLFWSVESKECH